MFRPLASVIITLFVPAAALAQSPGPSFEVGGQLSVTRSSQFDATDTGVGARIAWLPRDVIGIEAELTSYPGDFPGSSAFSANRLEAMFGATTGVTVGRVRPFAKVRPGLLRVGASSQPLACILIFPPPLSCTLAAGRTLFALDIGGGLQIATTRSTFIRFDLGDRMVRYPGPVFDANRQVRDRSFFSHDLRTTVGGGLRF